MTRLGTTFAFIGVLLCYGGAHAADRWMCTFRFENDPDPTHVFEGPVSVEGHKLLVYSGDSSFLPNSYDIVEDTPAAVIAIWPKPTQIAVAIVDRKNMSFKIRLLSVSGTYEERLSGTCRAAH